MKLSTRDLIDLCHTKARYYQDKASETLDKNYLSDSKAFLAIVQHLQDFQYEQLVSSRPKLDSPQHPTATLDSYHSKIHV